MANKNLKTVRTLMGATDDRAAKIRQAQQIQAR